MHFRPHLQMIECNCGKSLNFKLNATSRVDPTRTTMIRSAFMRDSDKRFRELKKVIRESVITNDCFNLREDSPLALVRNANPRALPTKAFEFKRTGEKVQGFMDWLNQQEELGVLEIVRRPGTISRGLESAWTDTYIQSAYQKGISRARDEMRKAGRTDLPELEIGGLPIRGVMNGPMHADRLGAMFTRTFSELKGIDQAMDQQISRVLTEGLLEGKSPKVLAKTLTNRVDKIGIVRARTLARTEVIRAHHIANVTEYKSWGVVEVEVQAEWLTAGYNVCPICSALEGKKYSLEEIEPMIPAHPNCRCTIKPIIPEEIASPPPSPPPTELPTAKVAKPMKKKRKKRAPAVEPFTRKDTTEEIQDYLHTKYRKQQVVFDLTGMDVELANDLVPAIERVADEFPDVFKKLDYIGTYKNVEELVQRYGSKQFKRKIFDPPLGKQVHYISRFKFNDRTYAHAFRDGKVIGLNDKFWNSKRYITEKMKRDVIRRWHPEGCADPVSIFTHEFGHIVDFQYRKGWDHIGDIYSPTFATGTTKVSDIHTQFVMQNYGLADDLSRYATTNNKEAWAEAFAQRIHAPTRKWNEYTERLDNWIENVKKYRRKSTQIKAVGDATHAEVDAANKILEKVKKDAGLPHAPLVKHN